MNFDPIVAAINEVLKGGNFLIVEQRSQYAKFQSKFIALIISYSSIEKQFSVFVGRSGKVMIELYDKVYLDVFGTNLREAEGATFAEKFVGFLKKEGRSIVNNDLSKIEELESYEDKTSKKYTAAIINRQNLAAADKAWNENKFQDFIEHLNKVDNDFLSKAYSLKRKIAVRKIEDENL